LIQVFGVIRNDIIHQAKLPFREEDQRQAYAEPVSFPQHMMWM